MSGASDSDSDCSCASSENPDCNICDRKVYRYTPCCHNPLCEKHADKYIVAECTLCSDNDESICTDCKGINAKSCGCDLSSE